MICDICDGRASNPNNRNMMSCESHVIPSKNRITSFLNGRFGVLPITIADTYSDKSPFPPMDDAKPLANSAILRIIIE